MARQAVALPPEFTERLQVDHADFAWWLEQKRWAWQQLERGELGLDLQQAQLLYLMEDPVLWCRAFLDEPDTGEPYDFWTYQRESVRAWYQDVIHQDGAEVGKTREIVALILWIAITGFGGAMRRPWILVGAPQQTHLDEIILEIEEHVGVAEGQDGHVPLLNYFWRKPKKTPHYMMRFVSPNPADPSRPTIARVYFRPAGHDGEAFRGVHVNALGIMDEAAKVKNPVCWSEFHRALKPGCRERIYSVPDGDRSTEYYRMTQEAVPGLREDEKGMRLFRWPKTLMPSPFWNDERDREMQRRYGGKDSPGYQRNVLGLHGQQENPVWSWDELEPNIRDVPEFRCLRLRGDKGKDELAIEAYRVELSQREGKKVGREAFVLDRAVSLGEVQADIRAGVHRIIRDVFSDLGPGVYWAGADLGYAKDPSEFMLWKEIGLELRRVLRISARGIDYPMQCEIIYALDELFGFRAAWGVDFGNAGTAVVQMLQNLEQYADGHYDERMMGFHFASAVDCIDEEGNVLEQDDPKTGAPKPVRQPAKEWATNLITNRYQSATVAMPYETDLVDHYTNHTAREGARHRIFDKTNDHTIDADRVAMLRKVFDEQAGYVDVFSSGAHERRAG